MIATNLSEERKSLADIWHAVRYPHLWLLLGWQDIKQRYRRSMLGPFWLTISTAFMVASLGLVYSRIFGQAVAEYLPYLAAGQMQKHVTVNEALTRLDALVQCRAASRTVATAPAAPEDGRLHILPETIDGEAWSAFAAGDLVRAEAGSWVRQDAPEGLLVWIGDEAGFVVREGEVRRGAGRLRPETEGGRRRGNRAVASPGHAHRATSDRSPDHRSTACGAGSASAAPSKSSRTTPSP